MEIPGGHRQCRPEPSCFQNFRGKQPVVEPAVVKRECGVRAWRISESAMNIIRNLFGSQNLIMPLQIIQLTAEHRDGNRLRMLLRQDAVIHQHCQHDRVFPP